MEEEGFTSTLLSPGLWAVVAAFGVLLALIV
jgi:hypothetical protein